MDLDLALHRRQLSYLSTELARTRIEIREAGLSVEETRRLLDERRRAMARRIRSLYMAGPPSFEHVLLTASSPAEVVTAYRWATRSSLADRSRVEEYRSAEVAWNDALHNLEGKKAALTLLLSSERVRTRELETLRRERSQLLSGVQKEALTQQGTLTEMIETRDALERLVRALSEGKTVSPDMRVGFDKFRGLLPWPVPGKILVPFGAQKNARFETLVPHPGIDLAVTEGEPIRAVHDGVVAFSDWFKGFGNLLVVEHGGGFMSVYAHASERLVATGDKVSEGQVIARAGDTGSLDGAKLYFEIIKDGKAENPVSWLTRR
jgi:septal ring factor EnvC (AmiA/AmiB activator)